MLSSARADWGKSFFAKSFRSCRVMKHLGSLESTQKAKKLLSTDRYQLKSINILMFTIKFVLSCSIYFSSLQRGYLTGYWARNLIKDLRDHLILVL